jgi:hypothetical protein
MRTDAADRGLVQGGEGMKEGRLAEAPPKGLHDVDDDGSRAFVQDTPEPLAPGWLGGRFMEVKGGMDGC